MDISIAVPAGDISELDELASRLDAEAPVESQGLDGQSIATILLAFYLPSIPLLKVWLERRVQERKGCVVSVKGKRLSGYTADEVATIVKVLEADLQDDLPEEKA